jgi:acetone carboxylase gamma subunit
LKMEENQDTSELEMLIQGRLDVERVRRLQMEPKDPDRMEKYIAIRQKAARYSYRILLPLSEKLCIVDRDGNPSVMCNCGYDFGDYRENWKLSANIYVYDTVEKLDQLYGREHGYDPTLIEMREYICPGCASLLDTEVVPYGYPVLFDFLPDIGVLYEKWLGITGLEEYSAQDNSDKKVATFLET